MNTKYANNGWLDRYGRLWPCKFNHHCKASIKLGKKFNLKHTIEYLGWIKVHDAGVWFFEANLYNGRIHVKPTELQKKWLIDNGYKIRE